MSEEEQCEPERLSRSHKAERRQVGRAQIILGWLARQRADETARQVGCNVVTVYYQLHQFNARGMAFVEDAPRSGRPRRYDEQQRGQLVLAAKTKPEQLGLPYGHWTLDRLVAYVQGTLHIAISRSQLAEVLT
ncbi:MAG: helix-turn-helix domain-containing protein, partial [Blastochloris sp.]|nr:helix-turn-helix domain-containing protein [Blastochloris sp.]